MSTEGRLRSESSLDELAEEGLLDEELLDGRGAAVGPSSGFGSDLLLLELLLLELLLVEPLLLELFEPLLLELLPDRSRLPPRPIGTFSPGRVGVPEVPFRRFPPPASSPSGP